MLAGNVVALLSPLIFIPILTFAFGRQRYDWESMKFIKKGDDSELAASHNGDLELIPGESDQSEQAMAEEQRTLKRAAVIARSMTIFLTISLLVLWPMPMYGSSYIFSKKFFTGWVVVGILWIFCSSVAVGLFPLWQSRKTSSRTIKLMFLDLSGKGKPAVGRHIRDDSEESHSPSSSEKVTPKGE